MQFNRTSQRVRGYMLGYYAAMQEQRKALKDIPLKNMSGGYLIELKRRAEKETAHLTWYTPVDKRDSRSQTKV